MGIDERMFPEMGAGGYHRQSGRVAFYARIASILPKESRVLEFGAGRGRHTGMEVAGARVHTDLAPKVGQFVVFDVDPVVLENPDTTDRHCAPIGDRLPFEDNSFDVIVSWMVFEHISDPEFYMSELDRILKPGGWICAATPNKWSIVGIVARLVPNRLHVALLRFFEPRREEEDTFPTTYLLNTVRALKRYFPPNRYGHHSYYFRTGPAYHGGYIGLAYVWQAVNWLLPPSMKTQFHIFLQKRPD